MKLVIPKLPTPKRLTPVMGEAVPREVDARYVDACRAGDRAALDRFVREHVRLVERVLGRLVGPTPELEDLVQVTFIEAMKSFPAYRGEASLASWVTRIAVHTAYRHLRRGLRRFVSLEAMPVEADVVPIFSSAPRGTPDGELDARRSAARLHVLLDRIKPKKRIAFLLFVVEGRSVEEIAALTGSSRTAVKSQLFFARREMQALVKSDPVLSEQAASLLGRPPGGLEEESGEESGEEMDT